jgi:hypothetical protein
MLVSPLASIIIETLLKDHGMFVAALVAKWFVFWAVGVRLFIAGLRQIFQPRYTAQTILGIKSEDSLVVVRELGFANTAIGSVSMGGLLLICAPSVPIGVRPVIRRSARIDPSILRYRPCCRAGAADRRSFSWIEIALSRI